MIEDPKYSYKLSEGQFGLDVSFSPGDMEINESEMSVVIPYADGKRRDGVGDLLEVGGIDTERHKQNPIVLFDHGKSCSLPIGLAENPNTHEYTNFIDPINKVAKVKAFFYQGTSSIGRGSDYDHSVFCEQIFDLISKKYIRAGSIGYQVKKAQQLFPDYEKGTPQGLHLLQTLMLEASAVVLPANQDTVIKMLSLPKVCGKRLSPYLVKSLTPYAPKRKAQLGYERKGYEIDKQGQVSHKNITHRPGDRVMVTGRSELGGNYQHYRDISDPNTIYSSIPIGSVGRVVSGPHHFDPGEALTDEQGEVIIEGNPNRAPYHHYEVDFGGQQGSIASQHLESADPSHRMGLGIQGRPLKHPVENPYEDQKYEENKFLPLIHTKEIRVVRRGYRNYENQVVPEDKIDEVVLRNYGQFPNAAVGEPLSDDWNGPPQFSSRTGATRSAQDAAEYLRQSHPSMSVRVIQDNKRYGVKAFAHEVRQGDHVTFNDSREDTTGEVQQVVHGARDHKNGEPLSLGSDESGPFNPTRMIVRRENGYESTHRLHPHTEVTIHQKAPDPNVSEKALKDTITTQTKNLNILLSLIR